MTFIELEAGMIHAFFYGIVLAFGLIVPLGVQNIFIFNQGARQPHIRCALPSVLTAAVCDSALIILSVLGVSVAFLAVPWLKTSIYLMGFCFLMYMGWVTWHAVPDFENKQYEPLTGRRQILFAASVSLLNPHAILDTVGVIGTSSLQFAGTEKIMFVSACILSSTLWFFGLCMAGYLLKKTGNNRYYLKLINKVSACILWAVGTYMGVLILH